MKEFISVLRRFVPPYRKYLMASVLFNILSAILNVFSFALIIPILQILFKLQEPVDTLVPWSWDNATEVIGHNLNYFVSRLIESHGASTTLLLLGLFLAFMTLLKTGGYFLSSATMIPIRTGVVRDIRVQLYNKLLSLPMGFFSEERKGDIIARMSGDVNEIENSIMSSLDMLFKNPILIMVYFGTLIGISWQLTLFTIIFAPIVIGIMSAIGKRLKADSVEAQNFWSDTMSQVEETLGGLRVIKAFLAENKMVGRFENITENMRSKRTKVSVRQASAHPVSEFLGSAMIAIVMWFGGKLILGDNPVIDAPVFIAYIAILYSVIQPIKDLSKAAYGIPKGLASMERIDVILNAENGISDPEHPVSVNGFNDRIELRNVSFRYSEDGREVLKDVNLTIPKGKTVAIVGASGAGKSTLVDLIPRFYDVCKGEVLIDGVNVKDMRLCDLRALMGNVNQDPILFNDTIFNNIAFGVDKADIEQVREAARIANAEEFILEKELAYDENIGDRGCRLSGGQRQRISIARAILKNPPILILDEATASLDTESERIVQDALDHLMSTRTTIAIAHRLSTVKNADTIIVMNEGRIVESGRHEELIALNGYYRKLYDMQTL